MLEQIRVSVRMGTVPTPQVLTQICEVARLLALSPGRRGVAFIHPAGGEVNGQVSTEGRFAQDDSGLFVQEFFAHVKFIVGGKPCTATLDFVLVVDGDKISIGELERRRGTGRDTSGAAATGEIDLLRVLGTMH